MLELLSLYQRARALLTLVYLESQSCDIPTGSNSREPEEKQETAETLYFSKNISGEMLERQK